MPFDPNLPAAQTRMKSVELRNNFTALKALIDALTLQVDGQQALITALQAAITSLNTTVAALANIVPIGAVLPWFKSLAGVPVLPENFVECNGQVLNDPESPMNGQTIENLNNGQMFLRGGITSGTLGGSATHTHDIEVGSGYDGVNIDNGGSGQALDANPKSTGQGSSLPPYCEVVYVMRVR